MNLSIIVPIYGVEKFLRQCVDSILAQQHVDFEVILIDDGSKDGCPAICDEYQKKDARVRVVHKINGGYGSAVNVGLRIAQGDWIGIVEPDDWIEPDMYAALMAKAGDDVDLVKGNYTNVEVGGKLSRNTWVGTPPKGIFTLRESPLFLRSHPSIWTCVYRKKFLSDNGIEMQEIPGAGWTDNLFQVKTMCMARGMRYVDREVYNYRRSPDDVADLRMNWEIPFDRSMEIHSWLEAAKVDDPGILASLCWREMWYVDLLLEIYRKVRNRAILRAVKELTRRFRPELIVGKYGYSCWEQQFIWECQHWPRLHFIKEINRRVGRLLFRIEKYFGIGVR